MFSALNGLGISCTTILLQVIVISLMLTLSLVAVLSYNISAFQHLKYISALQHSNKLKLCLVDFHCKCITVKSCLCVWEKGNQQHVVHRA